MAGSFLFMPVSNSFQLLSAKNIVEHVPTFHDFGASLQKFKNDKRTLMENVGVISSLVAIKFTLMKLKSI
ncbi:MAG: hypothetical protein A4E24_00626 [Methanomethylovorans sp. PtaU1.Bin093]|jgi:hypothetical protein|nr:MAG: hypothetical protein A4E24_00626 [Methanomethylovorans sp. PtaU1.Bin093]